MTILEALEHIYIGDIYDDKGFLTAKGYLTLQTLEGVKLTETVNLTQQPKILFLCDGGGCSKPCHGKNEYCKHTSNIRHAINFNNIANAGEELTDGAVYVETEPVLLAVEPETGAQREE